MVAQKKKRYFVIFILGILMLSFLSMNFVSAQDSISSTLKNIVGSTNSYDDTYIVYGDQADFYDMMSAYDVSNILPVLEADKSPSYYVKKASEVGNYKNKNLILIGGPCANEISEKITDEAGYNCADWKFDFGKSLVKVFDNGDGKVIMVSGTSKSDTLSISDDLKGYDSSTEFSSSEVVIDTPFVVNCGNDFCDAGETSSTCAQDCSDTESIQLTSGITVKNFGIYGRNVVFTGVNYNSQKMFDATGSSKGTYLLNLDTFSVKKISDYGVSSPSPIYGDYVVIGGSEIVSDKNGNPAEWPAINLYQISTGETTTITNAQLSKYYDFPFIYENKVFWTQHIDDYDHRNQSYELWEYDLVTEVEKKVTDVNRYNFYVSGISEDYLVYSGPTCDPEYCIPSEITDSSGNIIVENAEESDANIFLLNIKTGEKIQITTNTGDQLAPAIYGNSVIWVDLRSGSDFLKYVYLYDIQTKQIEQLTLNYSTTKKGITALSIYGDKIVWTNSQPRQEDVYLYDLTKGTTQRISTDGFSGAPQIYGNAVVWINNVNNGQDLYMKAIPSDMPTCYLNQVEQKTCVHNGVNYVVKRGIWCEIEISYDGMSDSIDLIPLSQKTLQNGVVIRKDARDCNSKELWFEFK
jgi:beta propeller repeat protein